MNKKKLKQEKGFFSWKVNQGIAKTSNLMIVIILVVFCAIAIFGISLIRNKKYETIFVPNYEHVYYNDEINTHFAIIATRDYDTKNVESLRYRVICYNQGRYIKATDTSNPTEPGYRYSSFKAQAALVNSVESNDVNDMYYFTENSGSTSASHNYTLSSENGTKHPKYIYSRIQYKVMNETKVATFKEEIMLQPTSQDIERMNKVYDDVIQPLNEQYNSTTDSELAKTYKLKSESLNLKNGEDINSGIFKFNVRRNSNDDGYLCSVRCCIINWQSKYHIDMQTWIETEDGKYLPYVGLYNFSSDHDYYNSSEYTIYDQTKVKYLCAKVMYTDSEGNLTTSYYKQNVNDLTNVFSIGNNGIDCTYKN